MIEKRDSQPLLDILAVVGGWPVAMDKWNETIGKVASGFKTVGSRPHSGDGPHSSSQLTACLAAGTQGTKLKVA